jgi:LacI family transcriptional regulator|tara:strand:+ start:3944 stop:5023 length:1080 start_codon:yes stop_codon:yes gene_type:complete
MNVKKASLESIAKEAKISISTASRVLNPSKSRFAIAEKTRGRVLAAARRQGYFPSGPARALKQGKLNTIGIVENSSKVFTGMGNSIQDYMFLSEALRGIYRSAVRSQYHVMLMTGTEQEFDNEIQLLGNMGLVDGLLISNRDLASEPVFSEAMNVYPKPIVYALDYPDSPDANWVAPDDVQGGYLATKTLIERGHQKILFAHASGFGNIFGKRAKGWKNALKDGSNGPVEGKQVMVEDTDFPALVREGFSAIVCANLPTANMVEESIRAADMRMPNDLEMVVFSSNVAAILEPLMRNSRWAVVTGPLSRITEASSDLLIDLISGNKPDNHQILFPYTFIHGQSCPQGHKDSGKIALQIF